MPELQMPLAFVYLISIFTYKKYLRQSGNYLKSNPLDPNKESQEIDVLSNPDTLDEKKKAINLRNLFETQFTGIE
jgi:hypothetical protein